ncbi:MAG: thioredoxin family protein [Mobilibacterium timonense]|uniref:thioredoxin-like (seleno)protein SaoT n=1 Tax=Mobilibacterium timonense TaxID=1871012 RepID=UPI0023553610|nr:thioredoxin-like (seleno)protein SaoT [Mobilibacterium timonense]MBM6991141.1 thioredoxin family protein [Mobilibacterium timonense]
MKHPSIEFITACACCVTYAEMVKEMAGDFPEVETRVYVAGEDMDYIPKYGAVTESTMIINESEVVKEFSKSGIREAFRHAIETA